MFMFFMVEKQIERTNYYQRIFFCKNDVNSGLSGHMMESILTMYIKGIILR